jgi:hypothetical protein
MPFHCLFPAVSRLRVLFVWSACALPALGCSHELADDVTTTESAQSVPVASNTFRWGCIDYEVRSARSERDPTAATAEPGVTLELVAKNRVTHGATSAVDWVLVLADGQRVTPPQPHWFNLNPSETLPFSVHFPGAPRDALVGAMLEPHRATLNYATSPVPLDHLLPRKDNTLHELVGQVFTTQTAQQDGWRVTVLSAELGLDSDVDGGERALAGYQLVDIVFEVHHAETNSQFGYFGADLAAVEVGGEPTHELYDSATLEPGQTGLVHFAFEIEMAAPAFELIVDTKDPAPQRITIEVPR